MAPHHIPGWTALGTMPVPYWFTGLNRIPISMIWIISYHMVWIISFHMLLSVHVFTCRHFHIRKPESREDVAWYKLVPAIYQPPNNTYPSNLSCDELSVSFTLGHPRHDLKVSLLNSTGYKQTMFLYFCLLNRLKKKKLKNPQCQKPTHFSLL